MGVTVTRAAPPFRTPFPSPFALPRPSTAPCRPTPSPPSSQRTPLFVLPYPLPGPASYDRPSPLHFPRTQSPLLLPHPSHAAQRKGVLDKQLRHLTPSRVNAHPRPP